MELTSEELIAGIKRLDRNSLAFYNYILFEKRYEKTERFAIIELSKILEIIKENTDKFQKEDNNLKEFVQLLHHTIYFTSKDDIVKSLSKLISEISQENTKDEGVAILLIFIHQILKTLSQIDDSFDVKFDGIFIKSIISWMLSDHKLIRIRSMTCATILLKDFHSNEYITDIWESLKQSRGSCTKTLEVLAQLTDFILLKPEIIKEKYFWKLLNKSYRQEDAAQDVRKQANFIIKKVIDSLCCNGEIINNFTIDEYFVWNPTDARNIQYSWIAFVTILENLEERQSHLILPSLQMLDKVAVPSRWMEVLILELLNHRNTLVLKWSIQYILSTLSCDKMSLEMITALMNALNNIFLYADNSFDLSNYKDFFKSNRLQFIEAFTRIINWKSVAMHACLKSITNFKNKPQLIPVSILLEISTKIRRIQNKSIREDLRRIYFIIFTKELRLASLTEVINIIEAFYNSNNESEFMNPSIKSFLWEKFFQHSSENVTVSMQFLQVWFNGNSEIEQKEKILRFLLASDVCLEDLLIIPSIKGFEERFLRTIYKTIKKRFNYDLISTTSDSVDFSFLFLFTALYSSKVDEKIILRSMETIKLEFSNIKCGEFEKYNNVSKLKELFVDNFSSVLISKQQFGMIYENLVSFLDKGGSRTVINVVNALKRFEKTVPYEILDRILSEMKMLIKKQGFHCCEEMCVDLTIHFITTRHEDTFYNYTTKLLDLDPHNNLLAATIYFTLSNSSWPNLSFYSTKNGRNLLTRGLLFGEPLHGDQKTEYDYCNGNDIFDSSHSDSYRVRLHCLNILYKIKESDISSTEKKMILKSISDFLINMSIQLNKRKSRYFDNSKQHRIKLRIMQTLTVIQSIEKFWDDRLLTVILEESNQISVTFLAEMLIADCITRDGLMNLLEKDGQSYSNSSLCSIFAITFMVCKKHNDKDFAKKCIIRILPWTMGQHFSTRFYAQITIFHLIQSFRLFADFLYLQYAIQESLNQGNAEQNMQKLYNDFRYNSLDYSNLLDIRNVFVHIPRITNMATDDLFKDLEIISPNIENSNYSSMSSVEIFSKRLKAIESEDNMIDEVQRKMNPLTADIDPKFVYFSDDNITKDINGEMIVVASLITKFPNLGGIARTCEVLGIKNLVLDSIKQTDNKEFKTLSMTSEKWLQMMEVRPNCLREFLLEKKLAGFSIVGAEQTSNSVSFADFKFPIKCVLLLGHEKEGIPANLISLLDFAVEIPQFGMVRSLNVHVTGALFMWEYCKQHLINKNK